VEILCQIKNDEMDVSCDRDGRDENCLQSAFHEKVRAGRGLLWCGSGGKFTGGWTKPLLLVENSMTHEGVTLLHTD
jgi:hypothetical protein